MKRIWETPCRSYSKSLKQLLMSSRCVKEAETVEEATRDQADSKVWFEQRAGRVTASEFKAACSTNPDKPSKSLIKMICYPGAHHFSNAATKWGISNESKAREYGALLVPYTRTYSIILGMYSCFFMANTFLPLARLFLSGATFFYRRDFFFLARLFLSGATFFLRRDFFLLARLFFH